MDEFRWLEDGNDPAVRAWTDAQNRRTRNHLDTIESRAGVFAQLTALFAQVTPSYSGLVARPGGLFAFKFQPPKQQRLLVILALGSAGGPIPERTLLDPQRTGAQRPCGHRLVRAITRRQNGGGLPVRIRQRGGHAAFLSHGDQAGPARPHSTGPVSHRGRQRGLGTGWLGVFDTRYPHPDDRPSADLRFYQQIYLHRLDTPDTSDEYAVGRGFPRIASTVLAASPDGRWLLASVANGDGGEYAHWLLAMEQADSCAWRQVTRFEDSIKEVSFGSDGTALYLRSVQGAPRGKILRLPTDGSMALAEAPVLVPEGDAVMEHLVATASHLYLSEMVGGPSRVRRFDLMGGSTCCLPIPAACGVMDLIALADHDADVFDDFAACARHLIERGYTCPARLAVEGRSNGGLLMGAFLTQHPELARAVVAHVGIYDMLRYELEPNGAFNVTEFGTVGDPAQFRAMHAYSPYHQVRDGTPYPAVFLLTGENDGRVSPANSRKMAARLQQANASANPILVQLSSAAGHGMGTALAERIA